MDFNTEKRDDFEEVLIALSRKAQSLYRESQVYPNRVEELTRRQERLRAAVKAIAELK
jgi:hypothetical protein